MNNHGYSIIMSTFRINTTSETIGDRKYFRGYKLTALSADIPADQPTTPVTNHVHKHDDNDICVVCHCEMTSTEEIIVTECNHTFHKDCLMQWYNHRFNCPMCRKGLYNHHPEAQRLVKDNLLLHNLYMLIRILHFNVPLKKEIREYLDKRLEESELWKQQLAFMTNEVTHKAHHDMFSRVMTAIVRNNEFYNTLFDEYDYEYIGNN